jgi:tripartite-type tricarboxylate transporter receptor subunit TctC
LRLPWFNNKGNDMAKHAVALIMALFCSAVVWAQGAYPTRPVQLIVPFPPGGVADLTGRPLAHALEKQFKQPVIIVNRSAAAGAVGYATVANAAPDGYSLLMALSSISTIPEADKLYNREPVYRLDQFEPVALITADPTVLVIRNEAPWKTVKDMVEDAKKRPGQISFSSSGLYGTLHVAVEMFAHAANIRFRHVPFTGAGPAITALLGGHVDFLASGPAAVAGHLKANRLRALAGWGAKRLAAYPDLPTFKELGYDIEFYIWAGLFATAGTSQPILKVLRDATRKAVEDPDFKATMAKLNTPINYLDTPEFKKFFAADAKRLAEVVKKTGRVEEKK